MLLVFWLLVGASDVPYLKEKVALSERVFRRADWFIGEFGLVIRDK